jgi:hypothetical protein
LVKVRIPGEAPDELSIGIVGIEVMKILLQVIGGCGRLAQAERPNAAMTIANYLRVVWDLVLGRRIAFGRGSHCAHNCVTMSGRTDQDKMAGSDQLARIGEFFSERHGITASARKHENKFAVRARFKNVDTFRIRDVIPDGLDCDATTLA